MGQSQLEKVVASPEGRDALEDALVAWELTFGEHPSEGELEGMAGRINRERNWFTRYALNSIPVMLVLIVVFAVIASIKETFKF
jgi:hypothetical protein